jgi:hypothetical protein
VELAVRVALKIGVSGDERLLDGVFGVLGGAEHVAAETEDASAVAVVQNLEGDGIAAPDELDELLVGECGQDTARLLQP